MSTGPVFLPATAQDLPAIRALVREAYEPYIASIGQEPAPLHTDYEAAVTESRVLLARQHGALAGLIVTIPAADHLLIENVAVALTARGTGIGAALLTRAEHEAIALGYTEVRLYTNAKMTDNLAYYPRRGYRMVERRVDNGFDRVHFVKPVG